MPRPAHTSALVVVHLGQGDPATDRLEGTGTSWLALVGLGLAGWLARKLWLLSAMWWPGFEAWPLGAAFASGHVLAWAIAYAAPIVHVTAHELCHAAGALCFLKFPVELHAESDHGWIRYDLRGLPATWARLAPYCLPWTTWALAPLGVLLHPSVAAHWDVLLAATLGLRSGAIVIDLDPRQTDLRRGGLAWSFTAAVSWALVLFGLSGLVLIHGPDDLLLVLPDRHDAEAARNVLHSLADLLLALWQALTARSGAAF